MKKLLNINEVSKLLNVTPHTLRRWDKNGNFPSIRTVGKHRRYTEEYVMGFLGKHVTETEAITVSRKTKTKGIQDAKLKEWTDSFANFTNALGEIVEYLQQKVKTK